MGQLTLAEHVLKYRDVIDPASKNAAKPILQQTQKELRETLEDTERALAKETNPRTRLVLKECCDSVRKKLLRVDEALAVCTKGYPAKDGW